jgi:hypothetical protein
MKNHSAKVVLNTAILMALVAAVTQSASASFTIPAVPDAGSTSLLMVVACAGLTAVRRFMR